MPRGRKADWVINRTLRKEQKMRAPPDTEWKEEFRCTPVYSRKARRQKRRLWNSRQ